MTEYQSFIQRKHVRHESQGFDVPADELNANLYNWQSDIARFSLRKGRSALFADCGLGKTIMQLSWADAVVKHTGKPVLILCPIAVASQTCNEASRFEIDTPMINVRKDGQSGKPSIQIVNYDAIHKLNLSIYGGVALDESSILKNFTGKIKQRLCSAFESFPFKLACTATPSPNDIMELGNHAEFLGIMRSNEMLSRWFINDTMKAGGYRLSKHATKDFWRWVASWAVCISKPSDIGGDDDGYDLPELRVQTHFVTPGTPPKGHLFDPGNRVSATEIHKEKRRALVEKASIVADLVNNKEQWAIWVDTDYEADALKKVIPDCVEVRGSTPEHRKEAALLGFADGTHRVIITKPEIGGFGLNWQHCHNTTYFAGFSFERWYQSIRRMWRFGQEYPVNVHLIASDAEASIVDTLQRKSRQHQEMVSAMASAMSEGMLEELYGKRPLRPYETPKESRVPGWLTTQNEGSIYANVH